MAIDDKDPVFNTTVDSLGEGIGLTSVQETSPAAPANGSAALVAKDIATGELRYIPLDEGAISTKQGSPGILLRGRSEAAGDNASLAIVHTQTLVIDKKYEELEVTGSCAHPTVFQVIWNDNATEEILDEFIVGSGAYTCKLCYDTLQIIAGAAGTQELLIKAQNLNAPSRFRASIRVKELL